VTINEKNITVAHANNLKGEKMSEEKQKNHPTISRREFLRDAGLVVGGAAIGSAALVSACSGGTTTETVTNNLTQTVTSTKNVTQTVTTTGAAQVVTTRVTTTAAPSTVTVNSTVTAPASTVTVEPTSLTILNPEGQMEPIPLTPLTPRIKTGLAGKTIYIVSVNFTGTEPFLQELQKLFQEKYPTSTIIYKIKEGSYAASDQNLWNEVAEKADAFVMGVGH
jgi:hypothetical protein